MKSDLELVNVCVLNAGFTRTTRQWNATGLSSPFARLYYIKKGSAKVRLPDMEMIAKPGYMYLIPSFMPHSVECEKGLELYYLFVYERYGKQTDIFDIYSFPYEVEANEAIDLLFENYCNYYPELNLPIHDGEEFFSHTSYQEYAIRYSNMDRFEKMQLQGFVWIVASFFMKLGHKRLSAIDERLQLVVSHIKKNISREISLDELSSLACITKSHLGRLFREILGCSPLQFILRTKLHCAQRLLITTDKSVNQIAMEVGFNDVSYFIRIFKKNIGFTPQKYRLSLT